jgi:hypothetical protein
MPTSAVWRGHYAVISSRQNCNFGWGGDRAESVLCGVLRAGSHAPDASAVHNSDRDGRPVTGVAPAIGASAAFSATALLSNSTTQVATTAAAWQSSATNVATVSTSGVVFGVSAGDTEIRATYQTFIGVLRITLVPLPTFTLTGIVQGANFSPVSGATVRVLDGPDVGRSSTSDMNGRWTLIGLRAGAFRIEISRVGFVTITRTVSLSGDQASDTSLSVAPTCNGAFVPAIVDCLNDQGNLPPTARCMDGVYSCSQNRSGTCSTHSGVLGASVVPRTARAQPDGQALGQKRAKARHTARRSGCSRSCERAIDVVAAARADAVVVRS